MHRSAVRTFSDAHGEPIRGRRLPVHEQLEPRLHRRKRAAGGGGVVAGGGSRNGGL